MELSLDRIKFWGWQFRATKSTGNAGQESIVFELLLDEWKEAKIL